MAVAHQSARDFVLFPPEHAGGSVSVYRPEDIFAGMQRAPRHEMDSHQQPPYALPDRTHFDAYSTAASYPPSAAFYDGTQPHYQLSKRGDHMPPPRPTPSASPSSMSQTYDQPPSILSSNSGASAHSTSSSVEGSPYVHATHQIPFQEKWSDPSYGLGINPQAGHDAYGHDPAGENYPNHPDLTLDPSRYPSFVGECGDFVSASFSNPPILNSAKSTAQAFPLSANIHESIQKESGAALAVPSSPLVYQEGISTGQPGGPSPANNEPFQAPGTPASVASQARRMSWLRNGADHLRPLSRGQSMMSPPLSPVLFHPSQNLFFTQSSGRFVPPLHSSCWFPLPVFV